MSNHVHAVFSPFLSERDLREILLPEGLRFVSRTPPLDVIMKSLKATPPGSAIVSFNARVRSGKLKVTIMSCVMAKSFKGLLITS
jgi:hypothetical protein